MALKEDSLSIDNPKLMNEDKLAIVLGTEGDGLAPETIAACDDTYAFQWRTASIL